MLTAQSIGSLPAPDEPESLMHTIYLIDQGLQLSKKSNRIVVKKEGKVSEEIPILELQRLLIFGNNQISTELMRYLSSQGVEVAFLSSRGRFKFRLVPETSKNIYLRLAQHDRQRNTAFVLRFSQAIVAAKIHNQRTLLQRYQRNQPQIDLSDAITALLRSAQEVESKSDLEELRGLEGSSARLYFAAYARLLRGDFTFTRRQYYPAPDPVNALLSFGYMLVHNELLGLLEAVGFDVFLGFFHGTRYGRASLATDLLEDLRAPVVDRLVLYLVNKGTIKPDQFQPDKEGRGVTMDNLALKTYLANYEKFMETPFQDQKTQKRQNFRAILREKVLALERTLLHDVPYPPFRYFS
uniref:CRISPR-associated endonuclease Cas1 n=1 Tax=Desulfobacca acetoxidans TaxID=60893 RepID=A0A7V6A2S9_9BACT